MNSETNYYITPNELLQALKNFYFWGILIIAFTLLISLAYSLSLSDKYTSSAILQITDDKSQDSNSSVFSGLAGLGLSGNTSNAALAINTLKSRELLSRIIKKNDILPQIFAPKSFNPVDKTLIFYEDIYNSDTKEWVRKNHSPLRTVTPSLLEGYEEFKNALRVNIVESNIIEISYTHISPVFAAEILELVITEANSILRSREIERSQNSISYLNSILADTNSIEVRNSISKLIDSHLRKLTLANIDKDYALSILDKPFIPEEKSEPFRKVILLIGLLLGLILYFFGALISARLSIKS